MSRFCIVGVLILCGISVTPDTAKGASVDRDGLAWRVVIEHDEVRTLSNAAAVAKLLVNPDPAISKAVVAAIGLITAVDKVGGNKGVEITGIIGHSTTVVTPKGKGPYDELRKVNQQVAKLGQYWPIAAQGDIAKVAAGIAKNDPGPAIGPWLAARDPGRAIGNATGVKIPNPFAGKKKPSPQTPSDPPPPSGRVFANSDNLGPYEKFVLVPFEGGVVALMFHTGYLAAEDGGGTYCNANRTEIGPWERWKLIHNDDNSVSLQSSSGHFLYAVEGGGKGLDARSKNQGVYEKFHMEFDDQGRASLRVFDSTKKLWVISKPEGVP